jgi:anti-anti-sigma regulatory factor
MARSKAKTVALPAVIDLDALDSVRDGLAEALEAGPVTVSAKAVERVSTNGLFLLLSAAETARRNDYSFSICDASDPMLQAIGRLGLGQGFAALMKG